MSENIASCAYNERRWPGAVTPSHPLHNALESAMQADSTVAPQPTAPPGYLLGKDFKLIAEWPYYAVSADGLIWTCSVKRSLGRYGVIASVGDTWRILKTGSTTAGYLMVTLRRHGVCRSRLVHQLVLEHFCGPRPVGLHACHENGIKSDNRAENLRWDTPSNNNQDKRRHGTWNGGERHPCAKLTESQVIEMRRLHKAGASYAELSAIYKLRPTSISNIVSGRNWRHIPVELKEKPDAT